MWTREELHLTQSKQGLDGLVHHVTPEIAKWTHTYFDLHRLNPGQCISRLNEGVETCAVVVTGSAKFAINGKIVGETDERESPFDRKPWAFYAPLGQEWEIIASSKLEVAICGAAARNTKQPLFIKPGDRTLETRGKGNNVRHVIDLLPADTDLADHLLVVEALTPGGNSSSYPPHKHDQDNLPYESQLEEVYFYRIQPEQGFAFQRVYTDDRKLDISMSPENGDVVLVPKGYHPVSAPHGYDIYYLNVMAGPKRAWVTHTAKEHAWLLEN